MTMNEIREHVARLAERQDNPEGRPINYEAAKIGALWEIAAQLAELNANLSPAGKAEAVKRVAQVNGHF